jgi:hypothetical protein
MEINHKLEKEFIRILQIKSYERAGWENRLIRKRNEFVQNQFKLNDEAYKKIERLNEMLLNEEKRIFIQYRAIEANAKLLVEKVLIDDYNIEIRMSCWNENYIRLIDPELDGDPFFETWNSFMSFQEKESYEPSDFTERSLTGDTQITKFDHCYSFHDLYYHHNDLTWFDICNIEEIWMDIKVDYQFFSKVDSSTT